MENEKNVNPLQLKIFGLDGSKNLAIKIAEKLNVPLSQIIVKKFSDGEWYLRSLESVRNKLCFIVQSTCAPVNENLMELMILVDALKRDSATKVIAIIPYFGYARQDRRTVIREPITAKLVANLLVAAGVDKVIFVDIHTDQIQGFFDIPTDNLSATTLIINQYFQDQIAKNKNQVFSVNDYVLVSPDYGGVKRVRMLADALSLNMAIVDKKRTIHNEVNIENVLGDVRNKNCIVLDDMIDTAGTMAGSCKLLKEKRAKSVVVLVTHPVFTGKAYERISQALAQNTIDAIYVSDTIELSEPFKALEQIHVVSIAEFLADIINAEYHSTSFYQIYKKYMDRFLVQIKNNIKDVKQEN